MMYMPYNRRAAALALMAVTLGLGVMVPGATASSGNVVDIDDGEDGGREGASHRYRNLMSGLQEHLVVDGDGEGRNGGEREDAGHRNLATCQPWKVVPYYTQVNGQKLSWYMTESMKKVSMQSDVSCSSSTR